MTSGDNAAQKKKKIQWMKECQEAFDTLRALCTSAPILAFADFTRPFKLHTEASATGLGAVLYQEKGGKDQCLGMLVELFLKGNLVTQPISWSF